MALCYQLVAAPDRMFKLSMATGYVGLVLLAASLALGPLNVLRNRPNPVSSDLRRDVGIWAAMLTVGHVVIGLQRHQAGRPWLYFLWEDPGSRVLPFRTDLFGAANGTGLLAGLVVVILLAVSNDVALRRLGVPRWKAVQRLNYLGFAGVAVHGALYQVLEKRVAPWVLVLAASVVAVIAVQIAGVRRMRTRAGGNQPPGDGASAPAVPVHLKSGGNHVQS